ncbi:MAG: PIG-L family deacetylase [Proteobacteria bacterium]|nr:PIG-L family deacetylase [Pseudomonadota bacterium]MBU4574906.1 PIG-L family deacetylase [Pseudomonadota bacterium]
MSNIEKVLVLAPHTDDGEFGCGGSIARFLDEGKDVYYVAFSTAEESVPDPWPKDILKKEVKEATSRLGIPQKNLIIYNYKVRKLGYSRQDILEKLIELKKDIYPDLVFLPSINDLHQDHSVISKEGMRAFKTTTILGYEIPWNNIEFKTQSFIVLSEENIDKKMYALDAYESQKGKSYANAEFMRGLARTRGVQINSIYAEAFEVIRWVIL